MQRHRYQISFVKGEHTVAACVVTVRDDLEVDEQFRNEWAAALLLELKHEPADYKMRGYKMRDSGLGEKA